MKTESFTLPERTRFAIPCFIKPAGGAQTRSRNQRPGWLRDVSLFSCVAKPTLSLQLNREAGLLQRGT